jgi:transposase
MATKRMPMRKTREILRQKWSVGLSVRQVAHAVGVSVGEVWKVARKAEEVGLDWATVEGFSEEELASRLYAGKAASTSGRPVPDWAEVHAEYQRKRGVTLVLLHLEYLAANPGGFQYTQFCEHYRRWLKGRGLTMHQVHRAGEKTLTDFSGNKPRIVNPMTGEAEEVELFVAVLGASSYTFARACWTQKVPDWIDCHVLAFEYFGGVTEQVVSDQLKSAVIGPCRYEPQLQRNFEEMAVHYGTVVLPARPRKPKDKALVEVTVQVAQRWILARLRKETFFSLEAMNRRIAELLEDLNHRVMKKYGASRRERYERLDRPALKALPPGRFQYAEWKKAKVNIDYHVEFDHHFYSVPFGLRAEAGDEAAEVRATTRTVEVYFRGSRIAAHARRFVRGGYTTVAEHMPLAHREHLEWSPSRLIEWAGREVGPQTAMLVEAILESRPHPEQGYRSCLGIMRLARHYGPARLEAAAARALAAGALSYRHLDSILKNRLDQEPLSETKAQQRLPLLHENVRGGDYYQ